MKRLVTVILVWGIILLGSVGGAAEVVEGVPSCKQCGMDRTTFAQSRVLLTYGDGSSVGLCSIHCAAVDIKQHTGSQLSSFKVADYETKALIDAREAIWVMGGRQKGVMTANPKWAFAKDSDARKFVVDHGGLLVSYEQAMKAAGDESGSGHAGHAECQGPGGLLLFNPAFGDDIYHNHPAGMWMFNYKYMHMAMNGLRAGTTDIPASSVGNNRGLAYDNIMMIPTTMTMDMHMFMAMYGINSRLTVMGMLNYLDNKMDMLMDMSPKNMMGMPKANDKGAVPDTPMKTRGLGDTELRAIYRFTDSLNGSLGLNLPTGNIEEEYTTMGTVWRVPYDMQLGSGTFDLKPAVTFSILSEDALWNWGGQAMATLRLGNNSEDYRLGNSLKLNTWLQRALGPAATWLRVAYTDTGKISGYDPEIQKAITDRNGSSANLRYMAATMPGNNTSNYGGQRVDGFIGASIPMGVFSLGLEGGVPLYQKLNGLQMKNDWYCTVGLQAMF
ncbi:MAG: nitrous oxide reductase accessory protein NosL [Desulfurivibrionaceae bacterium]